jgi:predicted  nucleic acid-binding Zn-ribbon protein
MAEGNGNYDWNDRMKRLEDSIAANWEDHQRLDRNIDALRASMVEQKANVDNLVSAIRGLIDRIPPENLR